MGKKQSQSPEWPYNTTKEKLLGIHDEHLKQFAVLSYVFGSRINEMRGVKTNMLKLICLDGVPNPERYNLSLPTLKRKDIKVRIIPFNPHAEPHYAEVITQWWFDHDGEGAGEHYPFRQISGGHSTRWYQYMLQRELGTHPHALRHLRMEHLQHGEIPNLHGWNIHEEMAFFGWKKLGTMAHYLSKVRTIDLSKKM